MNQHQTTIFDQSVSSRIEALLARCEGVKRGSDIDRPVTFDAAGQAHAAQVAAREAGEGGHRVLPAAAGGRLGEASNAKLV